MDAIIIFSAVLLGYIFLQSHGGEGLNIKAQLAPASTPQGRRDRLVGSFVLATMVVAISFVAVHQTSESRLYTVVVPLLLGSLAFLVPYFAKRKR